jgi:peptidoglycan DL-endopeptidase CwlO
VLSRTVPRRDKTSVAIRFRGRLTSRAVALSAAVALTVALGPSASANPGNPVIPSRNDVRAAQQQVVDSRRSVSEIQAALAGAGAELNRLSVAAEQAAEAYNGTVVHWQEARAAAVTARQRAQRAAQQATNARDKLAGLAVSQQTTDIGISGLQAALTSNGTHRLITQLSGDQTSQRVLSSGFQTWKAASKLARVYDAAAHKALDQAAAAKRDAQAARRTAAAAAAAQRNAVVSLGDRRHTLLSELASAQNVSVHLATARQVGLEQRRQARLARQRRQALRAEQRQQARQEARQQHREKLARQAQRQRSRDPAGNSPSSSPKPTAPPQTPVPTPLPAPEPAPAPPPAPVPVPQGSGGARAAVAFAYAQIGEPYVWGGAGPDVWDCSGLTMGAWGSAGVSLPHYAVDQYAATTPISSSQLRPGDLVFWASDPSDPSTIFHVGLYIGNGQMIHAPHTGAFVRVESIYDWEMPDFFGRP